eukprot:3938776-Rhodomonas_salina.10
MTVPVTRTLLSVTAESGASDHQARSTHWQAATVTPRHRLRLRLSTTWECRSSTRSPAAAPQARPGSCRLRVPVLQGL